MASCFYRLSNNPDPEERLEDAALAKALHDTLGDKLRILPDEGVFPDYGLHLGRSKRVEKGPYNPMSPASIPYWDDPGFMRHTTREWGIFDLEAAQDEVARLQGLGKGAVIKSILSAKHMVTGVRPDQDFMDALGSMVYSFCDRPPCLMVQEAVDMRYERRFLIMNREVATQSAVGVHLTPMSRFLEAGSGRDFEDLHLLNPKSENMVHLPDLTHRMTEKAREIAEACGYENVCIDLCLIGEDMKNGVIEPIEFNPMQPGMLGLYGCDPYGIARGVSRYLDLHPEIGSGPVKEVSSPVENFSTLLDEGFSDSEGFSFEI